MAFATAGLAGGAALRRRFSSRLTVAAAVQHPAYRLVKEEKVEEYGSNCLIYEHLQTKAQVLSVIAQDENKVFGVVFRTPPTDSTGLPHILEHSVLCGSKEFPTKEPFVELLKGSLQTFLNAFTYPDRTCYPVASQNQKDLQNLARVYLDAVFRPRAVEDPFVLKQEGWHYEVGEGDAESSSSLEFKGVVYNEMKGVYSSPEALMSRAAQQALFPENTYAVDSGGDPREIPKLEFEDFRRFHEKYYAPSNARIYMYGDDDPSNRLDFLDDYLKQLPASASEESTTVVERQRLKFKEVQRLEVPFPSAEAKKMISVNWLLTDEPVSPKDELGLAVLDHLLMGTSTSTLRKALTDSALGESVVGGGLSDELIQPTFSVGLKGVLEEVKVVEELIEVTLQNLATKGFDAYDIKASLNTIEFQLREFNTGSFPKGLSFMLGAMRNWIYDRDPVEALKFEEPLLELKAELSESSSSSSYFQDLISKFFLQNTHRVVVEMVPDATLEEKTAKEETELLKTIRDGMSEEDLKIVSDEMAELRRRQNEPDSPEALRTIPTLDVQKDLRKEVQVIPLDSTETLNDRTTLLSRELATAGIAYVDIAFDLRQILDPLEELHLMPLFARMLTETGTSSKDAVTLQRTIGAETGGISPTILTSQKVGETISDPEDVVYQLVLRGKCTKFQTKELFDLLLEIISDADFAGAEARATEILKETSARYESMFRTSGHALAASRIGAGLTRAGFIGEASGGLSHYFKIKELLEEESSSSSSPSPSSSSWPSLLASLERIRSKLLKTSDVVINLTGDKEALENAAPAARAFGDAFKQKKESAASQQDWAEVAPLLSQDGGEEKRNEGFAVPTQVNYVAKGGRFYEVGAEARGQDSVVRRVASLDYLWNKVRVIGGAYGGSCSVNPVTGTFAFSSYRDPNLEGTLKTYDATSNYLRTVDLDRSELDKAIIATIGDLDSPLTPDQKGFQSLRYFLDGTTDDIRQKWRDDVLKTDRDSFLHAADSLQHMQHTKTVVFASKAALDQANDNLPPDQQLHITTLLS